MTNYIIYLAIIAIVLLMAYIYDCTLNKNKVVNNAYASIISNSCIKLNRISIWNSKKNNNKKNPYLFIIILSVIMSIYSASIGNYWSHDRGVYEDYFVKNTTGTESISEISNIDADMEFGYLLLNSFIKRYTSDPFWLFFSVAFIFSFTNLYVLCKLNNKYTVSILFVFISLFFYFSLYLLRQAIAVSFSNLAFLSLLNNKKCKFYIYGFIACLFHMSAVVLFIFLIAKNMKKSIYMVFTLGVIILLFSYNVFFNAIFTNIDFFEKYVAYANFDQRLQSIFGNFAVVFRGLPFYILSILAFIKYDKLISVVDKMNIFVLSIFMCSFGWILSYSMYWFYRTAWYFMLPALCFIPTLLSSIKYKYLRFICFLVIVASFSLITFRGLRILIY